MMFLMMMMMMMMTIIIIIIAIIIKLNIFAIAEKEMCSLDNYSMYDLCTRQAGQPMS